MKELMVEAKTENLTEVFSFVQEELSDSECPKKIKRQIKLCVEEIFMNITHYAYNPETGPAKIAVEVVKDPVPIRIIISFIDHGKPYDPLKHEAPDLDLSLEEREIGGLGIFLVKENVDGIDYEYKDGQNILTIRKELLAAG